MDDVQGPGPADEQSVSEPSAEDEAEQIEHELDDLARAEQERDEYLDTLRRVQADFENYRKRMLREQTGLVERATEGLVEQLLPVLDSLDAALANVDPSDGVGKGLELVRAEMFGALERSGLSRIDAEGKPFDPNEHDAVMQDDGEGEPIVSEVVRPGYRLKGRVLRPAMVKVTR